MKNFKKLYSFFPIFVLTTFISVASVGWAQETSATFDAGSIKIGFDNRACSGSLEGNLRYNTSTDIMEFCDGTDWVENTASSLFALCAGVTDYGSVGSVCTDGSVYAGILFDEDDNQLVPIYATSSDDSTGDRWRVSAGSTDEINPDSDSNGASNRANLTGTLSTFPAIETCDTLTRHGNSDWYLPAENEGFLLYKNRVAIGGFNLTVPYWTSTESSNTGAVRVQFQQGGRNTPTKPSIERVRCVRRD